MLPNQMFNAVLSSLRTFDPLSDTLDILIISFVFYQLLQFARKSRAGQLVKGIILILVFYGLAVMLNLKTVTWVLNNVITIGFMAAVVIFQPELRRTLGSLGDFRDFAWLSVCGFLYQCGVSVVITLSAVYAAAVMGFKTEDTLLMVFLVNITAAVGAFAFGYVQDRIGHKLALAGTLCVWILAEFYSFWNMALWLAAIVGPLSYGAITWITGNEHRMAILFTGLFFVLSLLALAPVSMKRGAEVAARLSK